MIDDPKTANAFALPGGKVAVYTGILSVTRDEAGLAAVLGHEVAHVIARHGAERVSQQLAMLRGAQVVDTAFGLDPQVTQMGSALMISAIQLAWGRSQESEADHLGLIYMAKVRVRPARGSRPVGTHGTGVSGEFQAARVPLDAPLRGDPIRRIEAWLPEALKQYNLPR